MSKKFYTSDTHFGSERSLKFSRRPFRSVGEMDEAMIANWNSVVGPNDIVFHLGDFGDYEVIKKLNGRVTMVMGNYEHKDAREINDYFLFECKLRDLGFEDIYSSSRLFLTSEEGRNFSLCLCHEPSNRYQRGVKIDSVFNLFGHCHEKQKVKVNSLNVGVDCHNFTPIDEKEVKFYREAVVNHYDREIFMK